MTVRPATLADVPGLMALESESPTAAHWSRAQYEEAFRNPRSRRLVLVTEEKGSLAGFVAARGVNHEWEIENIVIASTARRRGLGTRLLHELLTAAQKEGAALFFLEVRESNRAARAFYEKLRFIESGRRQRYYHHPEEDAILYRLALE